MNSESEKTLGLYVQSPENDTSSNEVTMFAAVIRSKTDQEIIVENCPYALGLAVSNRLNGEIIAINYCEEPFIDESNGGTKYLSLWDCYVVNGEDDLYEPTFPDTEDVEYMFWSALTKRKRA